MQEPSPIDWAMRPLRHYAKFSGRAPRAEYWWYYLLTLVLNFLFRMLDGMLGTHEILSTILSIGLLLPWLAVTVRRLHDTNSSGWWLLLLVAFFGLVGIFVAGTFGGVSANSAVGITGLIIAGILMMAAVATFLVFMVLPGTEGPNDYGSDPYGPDDLEEVFA